MNCVIEDCMKEASTLIVILSRFGGRQPHFGAWSALWMCDEHINTHLAIQNISPKKLSGLPFLPNEPVEAVQSTPGGSTNAG